MPGFDWIPGVSQLKSVCQLVTGDVEGAAQTQLNFWKECPVASQITSTVQLIAGDTDGALETQMCCLNTVNNVANGIPVVGHAKGLVHHAFGDHDGGNQALNAATRTTVVLGTGVAVGVASGGLAAIPAGIAAGSTYDLVDSTVSNKPKGIVAAIDNVVSKPNAGNVFDATASVVCDGLTGYSGGQIGTKIGNQIKVNNLEAARAAKNNQLNAALFPEEGSVSSMTSGEIFRLGEQIKGLTSEINSIRQGPQYFYDVKSNQVVVEYPTSGTYKVPYTGNMQYTQKDHTETRIENGLDTDIYTEKEIRCNSLTPQQRSGKLQNYIQQPVGQTTLTQNSPATRIINRQETERMDQDDEPERNVTEDRLAELTDFFWCHIRMPQEFGYTGAALMNNTWQGLLHNFIRHSDQWLQHIPELEPVMNELTEIRYLLDRIRDSRDRQSVGRALNDLKTELEKLDNETFINIRSAFYRAQRLIYRFIQNNVRSDNYIGEGINDSGQVQVYFRVGGQIMIIAVSRELYPRIPEFGDRRPVRTVTTIYFRTVTEEDLKNENIYVGKGWPK